MTIFPSHIANRYNPNLKLEPALELTHGIIAIEYFDALHSNSSDSGKQAIEFIGDDLQISESGRTYLGQAAMYSAKILLDKDPSLVNVEASTILGFTYPLEDGALANLNPSS
jgi:hypothetical protein